jgi:two-component system NarL family response regulator
MNTSPAVRVMCVDDHRIVREGIAVIIDREPDMRVVGTAATGEEAVAVFMRERPDVTLMDLQLPRMTGLEAIKQIRQHDREARIIVLTMYQGDEDIHRALAAGAATYLLKDTLSDDLIRFIREVHSGRRPIRADVRAALDERAAAPTLTAREIQVMELVAEGRRNKEIASSLAISEETVQVHLRNIFAKLKVSERTAALNVAIRRGIVHIR